MAQLNRSVAALRITGEALRPEDITALLGHKPTRAQTKGEELVGRVTGNKRIAKFGMWLLEATPSEPESLDAQIEELLGKLTADLSAWAHINDSHEVDLFCGLFMDGSNEGLSVSPTSLQSLGQRGIELALDIYGPDSTQGQDDA
jgi:hypothetical protein